MKLLAVFAAILAIFLIIGSTSAAKASYEKFRVYTVFLKDNTQLKDFRKICDNFNVHHLTSIGGPNRNYDIAIHPAKQKSVESALKAHSLSFKRTIDDLQEVITAESRCKVRNVTVSGMDWAQYHGLSDIYKWVKDLALRNKRLIKQYTIGYSHEGRPIKAVKISAKPGNKAIFLESNIHAIEWISSATTTCFVYNLLKGGNADMKNLLMNYDWIFVPILNPDGFEYSHNVERLWRKNRKPTGFSNSSGICYGTDLNRNFGYKWGGSGYNIDVPCDHWYGGARQDTEPEVVALQHFVNSFPKNYIRMYLAFHSYGNFVLLPYGHTNEEFPPNYDQMMRIATAFAKAAKVRYGTEFRSGASGLLNYPVSGAAKDWAYGVKKIPFTATIELRDSGKYGFFLPPSQILEVCGEVTDGMIAMVKSATAEGLFK